MLKLYLMSVLKFTRVRVDEQKRLENGYVCGCGKFVSVKISMRFQIQYTRTCRRGQSLRQFLLLIFEVYTACLDAGLVVVSCMQLNSN